LVYSGKQAMITATELRECTLLICPSILYRGRWVLLVCFLGS